MNGCILNIKGRWAHFKRPETNNNPLTHDFITKTALLGLIGAVLGKNRVEMRELYPILSDAFLYGVAIMSPVKKESWAFTMRSSLSDLDHKAPKHMEFLVNPEYQVAIGLKDESQTNLFGEFISFLKNSESIYTPVLGLHNCPAELTLLSSGTFTRDKGEFETAGFFTKSHKIDITKSQGFRFGFDKIPTYQNNDFWNLPERYQEVIYPSENQAIIVNGEFYQFGSKGAWVMV